MRLARFERATYPLKGGYDSIILCEFIRKYQIIIEL